MSGLSYPLRVPVSPMCSPVGMDAPASSPAPPHRRPCRFTGRPPSVDPDRTICACGRSPRDGGRSLLHSYGERAEAFGGLFCVCHPCPGASSPSATDTCAVTGKDGRSGALYPQPVPLLPTEAQVSPAFPCLKRSHASPARRWPLPSQVAGLLPEHGDTRRSSGERRQGSRPRRAYLDAPERATPRS
jgi:hypothetical protein